MAAASTGAPVARALAAAMPGARLVSAGWPLRRGAAAVRRTTPASLDAWLAGEGRRPACATSAAPPRPARATALPRGATLIVCGLEPWDGAVPLLLARRPDLRVIALPGDPVVGEWPEFYLAEAAAAARRALAAIASRAALVVVSEPGAAASFRKAGQPVHTAALPSGLAGTAPGAPGPALRHEPYMVACGPIEARANTLLLLHLWREDLARGTGFPRLVLAGERGAQIEEIAPLLDWNAALATRVAEAPGLSPAALRRLIEGARAVLVPDVAGQPAELMRDIRALEIPMVAADTPAARHLGLEPRLDPLDGPGWRAAIAAAADTASPPTEEPPPALPDWPDYAAGLLAAIRAMP